MFCLYESRVSERAVKSVPKKKLTMESSRFKISQYACAVLLIVSSIALVSYQVVMIGDVSGGLLVYVAQASGQPDGQGWQSLVRLYTLIIDLIKPVSCGDTINPFQDTCSIR
jgi:hypothetical protein